VYVIAQGVSLAVLLGLVPVILVAALTDLSLDRRIVHSRREIDLNLRPQAEAIIKGLGAFICVSYRGGKDRGAQAEYMAKFLVVYAFAPLIALGVVVLNRPTLPQLAWWTCGLELIAILIVAYRFAFPSHRRGAFR
jgi:hypothetical protein